MSLYLSKSRYCSAVQCPKMLWLKKHCPEQFDDAVMNQAILDTGLEVGDLAMGLFGDFSEVPYGDLNDMIEETQRLLLAGAKNIAEASFSYNGLFCSVDLLKNNGGNRVEIYEVKSSTQINDIYYHDAAYQNYVLTKLGFTVEEVGIVHINNTYVRFGELEFDSLFIINNVTEEARSYFSDVEKRIKELEEYMKQTEEPEQRIGPHCFAPYSCGFFAFCTRDLPTPNLFHVAGMQKRTMFSHYERGCISFLDLEQQPKLNPSNLLQIRHELHDLPDYVEKDSIAAFLEQVTYPLYFLDFESFQPAIPLYDDSKPYEQIVFQYSLHYIETKDGQLMHKAYLAYPGADPRRELAKQLCKDIPINVCTVAYNMSFEKTRIKRLAELFPDLADHLMNIHDHIIDLMIPFRQKSYYTKAMQGSYSIKYVLPALYPNDPELDYSQLEEIQNGADASAIFPKMASMSMEELEKYRGHLLKYCELDTYAMVKIWKKLCEVV